MSWFENFFEGLATDVWRQSVSPEQTHEEMLFIIERLRLDKGQRVLDIPCADGRLALPLAQQGIKVTGVDLSARCLSAAKADAPKGLPLEYIEADMRKLDFKDSFDGAFCMGNSFGYFDREGTQSFLDGVARALMPGAGFILETSLAAETLFTVGGSKEWVDVDGVLMLMESQYDCRLARLDSKFIFVSSDVREEHVTQHWIFTAADICNMCSAAGFEIVELFGNTDGEPFALGSERLLLHATKLPQS
jgi:SAM-dependent methyltransferase